MTDTWGGDERRGVDGDRRLDATEELVTRAAARAAQQVARIHRRRLVTHAFVAALVAACVICIPIVLISGHARAKVGVANNRFNCRQWHEGATVLKDFIVSDAKLRRDLNHAASRVEVLTGAEKIYGKGVVSEIIAQQKRLDRNAQNYWLHSLVPRLDALAQVNCTAAVTTSGPQHQGR